MSPSYTPYNNPRYDRKLSLNDLKIMNPFSTGTPVDDESNTSSNRRKRLVARVG